MPLSFGVFSYATIVTEIITYEMISPAQLKMYFIFYLVNISEIKRS